MYFILSFVLCARMFKWNYRTPLDADVNIFILCLKPRCVIHPGNSRPFPTDHDRKLQPHTPGQRHPCLVYRCQHQHYNLCHIHCGHCNQPDRKLPFPMDSALPYLPQDGLHHIHDSPDTHRPGPWCCSALSDSLSATQVPLDTWAQNVQVFFYFYITILLK